MEVLEREFMKLPVQHVTGNYKTANNFSLNWELEIIEYLFILINLDISDDISLEISPYILKMLHVFVMLLNKYTFLLLWTYHIFRWTHLTDFQHSTDTTQS